MRYKYHCIYCNHDWEEEREEEYKNAPCVMPCPKCGEYFVNRVSGVVDKPNIVKYRHYKGGIYTYITDAFLEYDRECHVIVYSDDKGMVWVRPRVEFFGYVQVPAQYGYSIVRRFEKV